MYHSFSFQAFCSLILYRWFLPDRGSRVRPSSWAVTPLCRWRYGPEPKRNDRKTKQKHDKKNNGIYDEEIYILYIYIHIYIHIFLYKMHTYVYIISIWQHIKTYIIYMTYMTAGLVPLDSVLQGPKAILLDFSDVGSPRPPKWIIWGQMMGAKQKGLELCLEISGNSKAKPSKFKSCGDRKTRQDTA